MRIKKNSLASKYIENTVINIGKEVLSQTHAKEYGKSFMMMMVMKKK